MTGWLNWLLDNCVPASLSIVWSLPAVYSVETAHQIEAIITGLRNCRHHLQLAVAVSVKPADWAHCISIDGFIATKEVTNDSTALEVFNMLATLMAPGMSACFDAEDLRVVFGTHELPTRVVSGVWLEAREIFLLATDDGMQLLKGSKGLAFMPARHLQLASLHKLLHAIRKSAASDSELVMISSHGLSS